jgi:hypothetical protein
MVRKQNKILLKQSNKHDEDSAMQLHNMTIRTATATTEQTICQKRTAFLRNAPQETERPLTAVREAGTIAVIMVGYFLPVSL